MRREQNSLLQCGAENDIDCASSNGLSIEFEGAVRSNFHVPVRSEFLKQWTSNRTSLFWSVLYDISGGITSF